MKNRKFWFYVAALILLALLWRWWKRRPIVADGVPWNPDVGSNLTSYATSNPDSYSQETIAYLLTVPFVSPVSGLAIATNVYDQWRMFRASEGERSSWTQSAVKQMEDAIAIHFPNSILR